VVNRKNTTVFIMSDLQKVLRALQVVSNVLKGIQFPYSMRGRAPRGTLAGALNTCS